MASDTPHESDSEKLSQTEGYEAAYSEKRFWSRVRRYSGRMGRKPLELALTLLYTLRDSRTPAWCKGVIIGALGYFISLVDALPDLTPVLGYTDDVGVMLAAIATLGMHVTPESRRKARETANRFLGDPDPESTSSSASSTSEKESVGDQ